MNTARIVVLTIAVGAGGIAAYLASGSDPAPVAIKEPVVQRPTMNAPAATADAKPEQSENLADASANAPNTRHADEHRTNSNTINVVRYGVQATTTTK